MDEQHTEIRLKAVEALLGYHFKDSYYLQEALEAPGSGVGSIRGRAITDGNKRLAMVGDKVLGLVLVDQWYPLDLNRKISNDLQQSKASNFTLNRWGRSHSLDQYINNNPAQGREVSDRTVATTLEALIAAVWLDSEKDFKVVETVITSLQLG